MTKAVRKDCPNSLEHQDSSKVISPDKISSDQPNVAEDQKMSKQKSRGSGNSKPKKNPLFNYEELELLGTGSYGKVVKVQKKKDGTFFAMKILEKMNIEKVCEAHLGCHNF